MRLAAHGDPAIANGGLLPLLPLELLGPDPGVADRPDVGVGDAGDEEGVVIAGQTDRSVEGWVQFQVTSGSKFWNKMMGHVRKKHSTKNIIGGVFIADGFQVTDNRQFSPDPKVVW